MGEEAPREWGRREGQYKEVKGGNELPGEEPRRGAGARRVRTPDAGRGLKNVKGPGSKSRPPDN